MHYPFESKIGVSIKLFISSIVFGFISVVLAIIERYMSMIELKDKVYQSRLLSDQLKTHQLQAAEGEFVTFSV